MKIVLTYDEAVAASEFLKTKKQTVKSKLVKEFLACPTKTGSAHTSCPPRKTTK